MSSDRIVSSGYCRCYRLSDCQWAYWNASSFSYVAPKHPYVMTYVRDYCRMYDSSCWLFCCLIWDRRIYFSSDLCDRSCLDQYAVLSSEKQIVACSRLLEIKKTSLERDVFLLRTLLFILLQVLQFYHWDHH